VKSADIIKLLKKDGWHVFNIRGSHHQFKHPEKKGKVTVPHPKSELPVGTVKSILKQAGIDWGELK
jgi:predicted RNA binding protein YcfA (HicA-like mRNA interferase family)